MIVSMLECKCWWCHLLQVDLLHPLVTLDWEQCGRLQLGLREQTQCVLVEGQVCVAMEYTVHLASPDLKSWKTMVTRTHDFALTSYDSHILIVGGLDSLCDRELTGNSWSINFSNQKCLPAPVPPLQTKRHSASAINVESAECLVVAGGANNERVIDSVEVLLEGRWSYIQRLITPHFGLRATVHDGSLYFVGSAPSSIYHCKVEEMLRSCADPEAPQRTPSSLWSESPSLLQRNCPLSFGRYLTLIGVEGKTSATEIHACTSSGCPNPSVHVADAPDGVTCRVTIGLPTGELLVMGKELNHVFKGSLQSEFSEGVHC